MKKITKMVLPVILVASVATSTFVHASLFDTFVHNIAAGLGKTFGKHTADYVWLHPHRNKILIGAGIAVAVWYWKKQEDEKERKHCNERTAVSHHCACVY